MLFADLPGAQPTPEMLALKEVHRARKILDKVVSEWWEVETFDRVHDAAELLKLAAWRLRTDDAA